MNKWATLAIIIMLAIVAVTAALVAGYRKDTIDVLKHEKKVLIAQNKQLTQDIQTTKADAYRDGLIACGNEDVTFLNQLADEYDGTALEKFFRKMAMGWAYDDDTLNQMTEDYMSEGSL